MPTDPSSMTDIQIPAQSRPSEPMPNDVVIDLTEVVIDLTAPSPAGRRAVSVVVPTRNEAGNVEPLVSRIAAALRGIDADVLFVDDSDDATPRTVQSVSESSALPVHLLHRPAGARNGGLGGAVQAGIAATDAVWVVVMDGDLQHPPELIPALLEVGNARRLDVVVASRYSGTGAADGLSSPFRKLVSALATSAARLLFPRLLARVSDPMSGFFAVRRDVVDPAVLRPRGFKILMEILARSAATRVDEVPFRFGERHDGESKASGREALRYLRQLIVLRAAAPRAWMRKLTRFAVVGASGIVVNLAALHALQMARALGNATAALVATEIAIAWNFSLNEAWVFRGARVGSWWGRAASFWALNTATLALQLPLSYALDADLPLDYVQATLLSLVLLVTVRFMVCDRLVYRAGISGAISPAPQTA